MVKKLFALASVSALTGLVAATGVAGCTTETVEPGATPDSGAPDAKKDSKGVIDDDSGDEPVDEGCEAKDAVDHTKFAYTKAFSQAAACTTTELEALTAYFDANSDKQDFSIAKWAEEVSENCGKCVFTPTDADAWGPILVKDDKLDGVNNGGCLEVVSGKEACGQAYQQVNECLIVACLPPDQGGSGTCTTQDEFNECRNAEATLTGPCGAALTAVQKECGSSLGAYIDACTPPQGAKYIFEGTIPVHCITGGGTPDAGDGG
jgi:hypothetical protein